MATSAAASSRSIFSSRRGEHAFFALFVVLIAGVIFLGFAQTYFLVGMLRAPLPGLIIHFHALVFTSWFVLLLLQSGLATIGHIRSLNSKEKPHPYRRAVTSIPRGLSFPSAVKSAIVPISRRATLAYIIDAAVLPQRPANNNIHPRHKQVLDLLDLVRRQSQPNQHPLSLRPVLALHRASTIRISQLVTLIGLPKNKRVRPTKDRKYRSCTNSGLATDSHAAGLLNLLKLLATATDHHPPIEAQGLMRGYWETLALTAFTGPESKQKLGSPDFKTKSFKPRTHQDQQNQ